MFLGVAGIPGAVFWTVYVIGLPLLLIVFGAAAISARRGAADYLVPTIASLGIVGLFIWITANFARGNMPPSDWFVGVLLALSSEVALLSAAKLGRLVANRGAARGRVTGHRVSS